LRNSVTGNNTHIVATPLGVWAFRAASELIARWASAGEDERRRFKLEWRFMGHQYQHDTQNGNTSGFLKWVKDAGFSVVYIPYTDIQHKSVWMLRL